MVFLGLVKDIQGGFVGKGMSAEQIEGAGIEITGHFEGQTGDCLAFFCFEARGALTARHETGCSEVRFDGHRFDTRHQR